MSIYSFSSKKKNFFLRFSVTTHLILINVFIYFLSLIFIGFYGEEFFSQYFALTPSLIVQGKSLWTLLTSMFLHASFFHIFANMFSLFFIGNFLEKLIGRKRIFWNYIFSGIVGGIFFVLASFLFKTNLPAVGASGAIFGLLGVLAVLVPYSKIYLIAGPLILIVAQVLLSAILPENILGTLNLLINILIFIMIFSMLSFSSSLRKFSLPLELPMWLVPIIAIVPLAIIGLFVQLPIGNSAHFGGLVVGIIYGFYLRKKFPRKTKFLKETFK